MSRQSFHDRVVDALGRQIGAGRYAPGDIVPIETALADEFGVSRVVVREAMKVLAAKGLVAVRPRTGTRVQPRECWNLFDPQVIAWRAGPRDTVDIDDLMELRRIVEPPAVRLAARRATAADLCAMREAYAAMQEAVVGRGDYVVADLAFHGAILAACHNQFLHQLQGAIAAILKASFSVSSRDPRNSLTSLPLHEAVLHGIETKDPDAAAAAIERLIHISGQHLLRELSV